MAYVSVSEWRPEQVTEWLKGLDVCVTPYLHWFSNNEINGQQLLNLSPDELTHLGVHKIGHQELILEAVEHLQNFHYELDRENLQLLALRVSCAAHSLYNEIKHKAETTSVPTQTMSDVSNVINHVKPLVSWLDRPPFAGQIEYADYKFQLLRISLEMATCAQRDTFAERPISEIRNCSSKLAKLADSIIQDVKDPMLLQPASLDLATIKKRVGEDLGFFLIPSFHGIHQISDMKLSSPAHQSGKIQPGDEIVQVNYQTVVGWSRKKVLALFDESPNDLLLTLKRRPRHVKMYGQIYMKPYRLPSRKRASPYSRWNDNIPGPRSELLNLPPFDMLRIVNNAEKAKKSEDVLSERSVTSSSSDEEFGHASDSQNSVSLRLYLPKPRAPIQRRFTLSGPPRPSAHSEQFWRELQLERSWRSNQNNSHVNNSNSDKLGKDEGHVDEMFHLRDKSASLGNSIATPAKPPPPSMCIDFAKNKIGTVKFDLTKKELATSNSWSCEKEEREERVGDDESRAPSAKTKSDEATSDVPSAKMSISELNKMKRDAFFGNMDCSGATRSPVEETSEKVKRIIENFKTEVSNIKMEIPEPDAVTVPGKVSQLIGSFERKGCRDKSPVARARSGECHRLESEEEKKKTEEDDKESHGQMVNTINDNLLPVRDFYGAVGAGEYKTVRNEGDASNDESDVDYKAASEAREIVDTVKLALMEMKQGQDNYESRKRAENDSGSDLGGERKTEPRKESEFKPVPTQRKSKMRPETACPSPLPPKPRPRAPERNPELVVKPVAKSRTPPEPPPRPESTFSKAPPSLPKEAPKPADEIPCRKGSAPPPPPPPPLPLPTHSPPSPAEVATKSPKATSRGPPAVLNVVTEKPKSSGSTLESLKAMLSLGRKPLSFSSPRSARKKNAMLTRKRNVSVKELSPYESSGMLWHRNRKLGTAVAPWSKFYFVLQGPNFYGFKSRESQRADLFIHLPGFTCTLAEEVKSKEFAFKIYHTGTAFYFAANSREDLQQWLDAVTLATICPDEKQAPDAVTFSVSDSDSSDAELEPETCFPTSPKMKKFLGASSSSSSSSPVPKPARSHQNLASDSKKTYDIQKRFGSLKKLSVQKHGGSSPGHGSDAGAATEIASLDRKYLRFLGHKNTPLPVPTSQFRSYRRMQPSVTMMGEKSEKSEGSSQGSQQPGRDHAGLIRKTLHLSNPSLIHPDMADYRITQERLAEFRRLRNQDGGQESNNFMTLEQFMMNRQEEEVAAAAAAGRSNRARPPELRGFMTLEQFLLRQEEEKRQMSSRGGGRARESPIGEAGSEHTDNDRRRGKIPRPLPRNEATMSGSVGESSHRGKENVEECPQAAPRGSNANGATVKFRVNRRNEDAGKAPSVASHDFRAAGDCGCAACERATEEEGKSWQQTSAPDYPGIEYPPVFEPETYTLQYMLKKRRKRNANKSKKEDK